MKDTDSARHDDSSPKHSWHARKLASATPVDEKHPTATPAPTRQIGLSDVRETFDVPHHHVQYY